MSSTLVLTGGSRTMASMGAGTGILVEKWRVLEMQVANALVRRDALQTPVGRACKKCPACWCKRMHVATWYIMVVALGIMALSLLIAFGVGIVAPYNQGASFLPTTCKNIETLYNTENKIRCSCGSGRGRSCSSFYPCLKIFVKYTRKDGVEVEKTLLKASQYTEKCTITPTCQASEFGNKEVVLNYKHEFGTVGLTFPCLYNPDKGSTQVIEALSGSELRNAHLLAWPGVFTLISIVLFFLVYGTCGCKYICRRHPPEDVRNITDQLLNMSIPDLEKVNPEESERLLKQCCPLPEQILL